MLFSEPTAHSSIKIWSLPHVRHSHSCSKQPCSEPQHLKEDSQRYSGSVTLEIQKDLSAFKVVSFYSDGLGEIHQAWAEDRSHPPLVLGYCGNDWCTQAPTNKWAGDSSDITFLQQQGQGRSPAGRGQSSLCIMAWVRSPCSTQRARGVPGQLLAVWADSSKGCLLSAARNLKGLVTLLSFQHFSKKRIYLASY